ADEATQDADAERRIEARIEAAKALRNVRNSYAVPPKKEIEAILTGPDEASLAPFRGADAFFKVAANVTKLTVGAGLAKPKGSASASFGPLSVFVPGLFDPAQERSRIEGALAKKRPIVEGKKKKLETMAGKAPLEVIERERAALGEIEAEIRSLEKALEDLA
ncbi:hypothetical protein HY251_09290, partial [bacterium]|nr:hypothetical protein [bacterium]